MCSDSHRRCSVTIDDLRDFVKFTGKHLCQSLFFNKVAGLRPATLLKKRLWHRCFPVKFVKVLRTTFFIERLSWLLLLLVAQVAIEKRMCMNIVFLYFYGMRLIINQIRIKLLLSTIRSSHS